MEFVSSTEPSNEQAVQLLDVLKQMRVPSRKLEECSEELTGLLVAISAFLFVHQEFKEFFINHALEMAMASGEEDRDRAFLLLTVWGEGEDDRVDKAIGNLNKLSVVDDYTRDIDSGNANGHTYLERGKAFAYFGRFEEALVDLDKAAQLGEPEAAKFMAGRIHFVRGAAYTDSGRFEEALNEFDKAAQLGLPHAAESAAKLRQALDQS